MPIFMKFGSITGDERGKYRGWIELQSAQINANLHGQQGSVKNPATSEVVITKTQDGSSSDLFRQSLWGEGVSVTIEFVRPGPLQTPYMKIELENVLISNFSVSGHNGVRSKPLENLSLNFSKITYTVIAVSVPTAATAR